MSATIQQAKSIDLYYHGLGSDKVYSVSLEQAGQDKTLWRTISVYGPRYNVHNNGDGTDGWVDFVSANKVYESIVHKKKKKGYQIDSNLYYNSQDDLNNVLNAYRLEVENKKLKAKFKDVIAVAKPKASAL